MKLERVFALKFAAVYPMYVRKAEAKGRTQGEVDEVIRWLTGYTDGGLRAQATGDGDLQAFFDQAPAFNPHADLVTGSVCGVRVQDVPDPLMRRIRILDKLVDELAKGRPMAKILRVPT